MRPVLFWAPTNGFAPPKGLEQQGWHVLLAAGPGNVPSIPAGEHFLVGLAAFDPAEAWLSAIQEAILATHPMAWIALMPPRRLENTAARQVIADTFFDFHTLPLDIVHLALSLGHAYGMALLREIPRPDSSLPATEFSMVGRSPPMQRLYQNIRRIADTDASVLITGETGTGKELAARAIHMASPRRDAPFVALNCAALPENLIQAELFGYEKGAFTDARTRKIGRIEMAAGGTVFLDEIGDLPLSVQATLLRFLQEHTIERLGGKGSIQVDVRVLAATHVDLEKRVAEGRFREDLYYRLNVLRLEVPPLRERAGDVELLAWHVFLQHANRPGSRLRGFSRTALDCMNAYDWPGNARELINRVHRAVVMGEGRLVSPVDLGLERRTAPRGPRSLEVSREEAERIAVRDALVRCRTVTQASAELGVSRMTLYRLMAKHGLKH